MMKGHSSSVKEMVAGARSRIRNLTPEECRAELSQGALLVDLREPEERQEHGVIAGALHVPRGMLEFRADPATSYHLSEFQPDRQIILHCASGMRSALAADTLLQMGYGQVGHIDGGFAAWKASGQPTERLG